MEVKEMHTDNFDDFRIKKNSNKISPIFFPAVFSL